MNLTKVISSDLDKLKRRIIKVLRLGKSDVQTANEIAPFGVDSVPVKDMVALYAKTGENGRTVIVGYINKNQIADIGETRIFSTDKQGNEKTSIHLKNDGTIEVGGDSDFMVRYSALETAFNQLKAEFNAHTHISPPAPVNPVTTAAPTVPSTANILPAKIKTIKTS